MRIADRDLFVDRPIVITEKLDGETCLAGETMITTEHGQETIDGIVHDTRDVDILTIDVATGQSEMQPLSGRIEIIPGGEWYEIEIDDGRTLTVTGNHLVWLPVEGRYERVDRLSIGATVVCDT